MQRQGKERARRGHVKTTGMYRNPEDDDEERILISSAVPVSWSRAWFVRPALMELVGTMLLVFVGAAALIATTVTTTPVPPDDDGRQRMAVAVAVGLTAAALMYLNLKTSGGHHNPVVSLAALICGRITARQCAVYVVAQVLGAVLGALTLMAALPPAQWGALGSMTLAPSVTIWQGLIWETVITFLVVLVQAATMMRPYESLGKHGPLASGLVQVGAILAAFPFTGACFNPVRAAGTVCR